MAQIPGGVPFTGFVAPTDSTDTYPVTDPKYGLGGYREVPDLAARDAIPAPRLSVGMQCYVRDWGDGTPQTYHWMGTVRGWEPLPAMGDSSYVHYQLTPSARWVITHQLHKWPSVSVIDSAGTDCVGEVFYQDNYTLIITFSAPFGGVAYLN